MKRLCFNKIRCIFGGDAALGPKNVITAVAQGHQAAVSIDLYCNGEDINNRPAPNVKLFSTKMGIHGGVTIMMSLLI